MSISDNLTRVFRSAGHLLFDDSSRLVFFGDCHRGNGGPTDDFARNRHVFSEALGYYYGAGFTYFELGDGDDLWKYHNFGDIRQAHGEVFGRLRDFHREGRLQLVWGNHDGEWRDKAHVRQRLYRYFDQTAGTDIQLDDGIEVREGLILRHVETGCQVFAVHGHQVDPLSYTLWWLSRFCVGKLWKALQRLGAKDPTAARGYCGKPGILERRMLDWMKHTSQMVICAHTHRPAFPRPGEAPYFNVGSCLGPGWISGIEIRHGEIAQVRWLARPQSAGSRTPPVTRELMAPALPLRSFCR